MLEPVEKVAVLALVYREMYRNQYSSAVSLDEDMASCPDEINLIGVIGSQQLADEDWVLIAFIGERSFPAEEIGRDLTEWSASRCEALLHAWPEDPREDLGDAEWAQPFLPRWELVAARMAGLEPLTWDREQRRDVYAAVSRQPLGEVLEDEQLLNVNGRPTELVRRRFTARSATFTSWGWID